MPRSTETTDRGFIYFIESETQDAVKIGFATNVYQRHKSLQSGNPDHLVLLGSVPATLGAETAIHRALKPRRIRLEWYPGGDDLVERIIDEMQSVILECAVRYLGDTGFASTDPNGIAAAISAARDRFYLDADDVEDILLELFPPLGA